MSDPRHQSPGVWLDQPKQNLAQTKDLPLDPEDEFAQEHPGHPGGEIVAGAGDLQITADLGAR